VMAEIDRCAYRLLMDYSQYVPDCHGVDTRRYMPLGITVGIVVVLAVGFSIVGYSTSWQHGLFSLMCVLCMCLYTMYCILVACRISGLCSLQVRASPCSCWLPTDGVIVHSVVD
jgi:hypothetical protein